MNLTVNKNKSAVSEITEMEEVSMELIEKTERTEEELKNYYNNMALKSIHPGEEADEIYRSAKRKAASLKRASANFAKACLKTVSMADELESRAQDIRQSRKKCRIIPKPPANAVIDMAEQEKSNFARGLNFYKLAIICVSGSFFGVVIELLWCLVRNGYIESRSGLVWGPFNLLYGFGACVLSISLYRFRNHDTRLSFAGGMLVGSVIEYLCSFFQEMAFGSRSWDYSAMPFNLNGRICLLYSIFWGFLGAVWIKDMYPRISKWILKIPNRAGKIITWLLTVFLAVNAVVSVTAVVRWSQRIEGKTASNYVHEILDKCFPDEQMEKIYANMEFADFD